MGGFIIGPGRGPNLVHWCDIAKPAPHISTINTSRHQHPALSRAKPLLNTPTSEMWLSDHGVLWSVQSILQILAFRSCTASLGWEWVSVQHWWSAPVWMQQCQQASLKKLKKTNSQITKWEYSNIYTLQCTQSQPAMSKRTVGSPQLWFYNLLSLLDYMYFVSGWHTKNKTEIVPLATRCILYRRILTAEMFAEFIETRPVHADCCARALLYLLFTSCGESIKHSGYNTWFIVATIAAPPTVDSKSAKDNTAPKGNETCFFCRSACFFYARHARMWNEWRVQTKKIKTKRGSG